MLTKCPECELPVSDRALSCPHCGYPLSLQASTPKKTKQHLRLPNGFGQISKLSNPNLRNPYRAMITVGKTDTGRPICRILKPKGYFKTYNEAYEALMEYNKNPYDIDRVLTVEEVYKEWTAKYFKTVSSNYIRNVTNAWSYCDGAKKLSIKSIRVGHIKDCMAQAISENIRNRIKSVWNLLLDYALEYGYVDKNYARDFKTDKVDAATEHIPFTDKEINTLWANRSNPIVSMILVQCYMGWRPQELGLIELSNVDMTNWNIIGGMKTEAGTNRVVPIMECIRPIIKNLYMIAELLGSKYLCCSNDGSLMTYDKYNKKFSKVREELKLNKNHRPHDPRKHFVTMCKDAHVDEYAIKRLIGHSISDLTEKVYTERNLDWLSSELNKLNVQVVRHTKSAN